MQIKKYRGKSVHAAMEKAKAELGPDAVLLHTRKLKPNLVGDPAVELIVAVDRVEPSRIDKVVGGDPEELLESDLETEENVRKARTSMAARSYRSAESKFELSHISTELAEIRDVLHVLMSNIKLNQSVDLPETVRGMYEKFLRHDLDPTLAHDLAMGMEACFTGDSSKSISSRLTELLGKVLTFSGGITLQRGLRVIALVGPTGVGKTTTAAKIAANFKLKQKKRVAMITIDTYRIAAVHQLQTFADIISVPLKVANDPDQLSEEVESLSSGNDLILIDTPGRSHYDIDRLREIEQFILAVPGLEVNLLISAATRSSDTYEIIRRFGEIGFDSLTFTKLDETSAYGSVVSGAVRSQKPLSYFTTGQDVAGDIEAATVERVSTLLLRGLKR